VVTQSGPFEIDANIKSAAGISDAEVYWTTDTTAGYSAITMNEVSPDSFTASIPSQQNGTEVFYYINVSSNDGRIVNKPLTAPAGYYHFKIEIVPVELISFYGSLDNNAVRLTWSTATEKNNRGFEVRRAKVSSQESDDSRWDQIGFVEGNGTTTLTHTYSFTDNLTDKNISSSYYYRLKQLDYDGSYEYSKEIEVSISAPFELSLEQNYPNPFNPVTTIKYAIPKNDFVSLRVYSILGENIAALVNEEKTAGSYSVKFDGSNLPAGVYLYRLETGSISAVKKFILVK
jgi:hypothetical protein